MKPKIERDDRRERRDLQRPEQDGRAEAAVEVGDIRSEGPARIHERARDHGRDGHEQETDHGERGGRGQRPPGCAVHGARNVSMSMMAADHFPKTSLQASSQSVLAALSFS